MFAAKAIEQCSLTQISDQCILRMRSRSKKAGGTFVSRTQKVFQGVLNILCLYLGLNKFSKVLSILLFISRTRGQCFVFVTGTQEVLQRVLNILYLYVGLKKFSIFFVCICKKKRVGLVYPKFLCHILHSVCQKGCFLAFFWKKKKFPWHNGRLSLIACHTYSESYCSSG